MPKNDNVTQVLYFMALYITADKRTQKMVDFLLSLDKETVERVKRIANAKNKRKPREN